MNSTELRSYQRLVAQLRIPEQRKPATPSNFRWQIANAWIDNRNNPKLHDLLRLVRPYA